jgi:hypothetical protein
VGAVRAADALAADVLVLGTDGPDAVRAAFAAASERVVVVRAPAADPSDLVAALVDVVGGTLVAAMLRAVVVAQPGNGGSVARVHLVTDEVCRAIVDRPPAA